MTESQRAAITTIVDIKIDATVRLSSPGEVVRVEVHYSPLAASGTLDAFQDRFEPEREAHSELWGRLRQLGVLLQERLPRLTLSFGNDALTYQGILRTFRFVDDLIQIEVQIKNSISPARVSESDLTVSQARLARDILGSLRALAWQHLRSALNPGSVSKKNYVFISYRTGRETFAEAVAQRLSQEGLEPWFDKWEVVAGDSLPKKIEEAFEKSQAFVPVITADYRDGKWASEELENALAKRVNEGYRIVPLLYDKAPLPQLLRSTVYVDCTDHSQDAFEMQLSNLIDGIFGIPRNPYRRSRPT